MGEQLENTRFNTSYNLSPTSHPVSKLNRILLRSAYRDRQALMQCIKLQSYCCLLTTTS